MAKYVGRCPQCNKTRDVYLDSLVGAAPVFCPCGAQLDITSQAVAVPTPTNTPQASVRALAVPAIERLTDKGLPIYISKGRQDVLDKLMRKAFPNGIPGMESL